MECRQSARPWRMSRNQDTAAPEQVSLRSLGLSPCLRVLLKLITHVLQDGLQIRVGQGGITALWRHDQGRAKRQETNSQPPEKESNDKRKKPGFSGQVRDAWETSGPI